MMLLLACVSLMAQPLCAAEESWSAKAVGFYCDSSICRCTVYYDTDSGNCYAIVDETGKKCPVFKMRGETYNAYFSYNDCKYFLSVPYWPTGK